jgi:large subunit ribosomal protein L32e
VTESDNKKTVKQEEVVNNLEKRRLMNIKKQQKRTKPGFIRQESWRYKRVKPSWRRPRGIDSKMRSEQKGWPASVKVGYRSPKRVRGFHPAGFEEIMIYNEYDLDFVNPSNQVVRIGHTVGRRKRVLIVQRADELGVYIVNPRRA